MTPWNSSDTTIDARGVILRRMQLVRFPTDPDAPPRPLPFLGHLLPLIQDPLRLLLVMARTRGDAVRIPSGPRTTVLLSSPAFVKRVLRDEPERFSKMTPVYKAMGTILGKGILTSEGEHWLVHRRIVQPAFHRQKLLGHVDGMRRAAEATASEWERAARNGRNLDVFADMTALTLQVVTETLLGSRESEDMKDLGSATDFFHHYSQNAPLRLVRIPLSVPTPLHRKHKRALELLDRVAYRLIDEKRSSGMRGTDVLSLLLDARYEDGSAMPRQQIRDEVLTLLAAGHDTTANALSWTFHLLGLHPAVTERVREELREVLGDRPVTGEDLPNLRYLRWVLSESMRLYPPAWVTARLALEDLDFGGVPVNRGDIVMVSPYVTHRRPDLFPNPEAFLPERFAKEAELPPFAYFPFGGGAHKCIGDQFAIQEAQIVLATLLRRFDLHAVSGYPVEPEPLITLRPKGALPMRVRALG